MLLFHSSTFTNNRPQKTWFLQGKNQVFAVYQVLWTKSSWITTFVALGPIPGRAFVGTPCEVSWSWLLITQLAGFSPVRAVLINIFSLWGTRHVIRKWCDDMFDMLAILLVSPGQGNYAAANSSLDAFAPFWSSKGRPGLRVQSS